MSQYMTRPRWRLHAGRSYNSTDGSSTQDGADWSSLDYTVIDWATGDAFLTRSKRPALIREFNCIGGTDGVAVTTSDAFDDAFTVVTIDAGNTFAYETGIPQSWNRLNTAGGASVHAVTGAVNNSAFAYWNITGVNELYVSIMHRFETAPPNQLRLVSFMNGGVLLGVMGFNSSRQVIILDSNGTLVATSTVAVTTDRWSRLACRINNGTGTGDGSMEVRIFGPGPDAPANVEESPYSLVPVETLSVSSQDLGGDVGDISRVRVGATTLNHNFYWSDFSVGTEGWIGPSSWLQAGSGYNSVWLTPNSVTNPIDANMYTGIGNYAAFIAPWTGIYNIEAHVEWESNNTGNNRELRIAKNHNARLPGFTQEILSGGTALSLHSVPNDTGVTSRTGADIHWMAVLTKDDVVFVESRKQEATNIVLNDGPDLWWVEVEYIGKDR